MQAPSSTAEPDEEGQRYLDVQRHAAAVQLLGRSLALAHLRAQLAMPKRGTLHMPQRPAVLIKQEDGPGMAAPRRRQQHGLAAAAVQPAKLQQQTIKVSLSTTAADLPQQPAAAQPPQPQQQQQQQHARGAASLKPRQLVHRLPDAAAAARFKSDEPQEEDAAAAGDGDDFMDVDADAAAGDAPVPSSRERQLAPRLVADPGQAAQQLAGWVRVAGEGGEGEGPLGQQQGSEDDGLLGPGAAEPDDMLDEEEWV